MVPRAAYKIGLVGPCGAGKTTLSELLNSRGKSCRAIAQEHSFIPDMWKKMTNPEILVFLDASYPVTMQRKKFHWTENEYNEQIRRLAHARTHADLFIQTDAISPAIVMDRILEYINEKEKTDPTHHNPKKV